MSTDTDGLIPTPHPKDPRGYYAVMGPGEIWPVVRPIPGWRFHGVRADGTLFNLPRGQTSSTGARCGPANAGWRTAFLPRAPLHDPDCKCGYRVVKDLETLAGYMRHLAEHKRFEDPNLPGGPVGIAVVEVTGTGYAAHMPRFRIDALQDPENCVRVEMIHLGQTMYLAEKWADGTTVPDDLEDKVREQYPQLTVHRVPTVYQLPGVPFSGLPTPGGNAIHVSGRFGRYGAAGALLRHEDRFLLVRRRDNGKWAPPGGALDYHDEAPWDAAQREAREEGGQIWDMSEPHGHVVFHCEAGWTFTTYAVDVRDPVPLRLDKNNGEITAVEWHTVEEMEALDILPEFAQVLPELLALYPEA